MLLSKKSFNRFGDFDFNSSPTRRNDRLKTKGVNKEFSKYKYNPNKQK